MDNPYASSELQAEPVIDAPRFRPLAVVVGWVCDIVFTTVAVAVIGIVVGIFVVGPMIEGGTRPDNLVAELSNAAWLQWLGSLLGFCGTMLGGFVAAWMGKDWPLRHAFAVGIASLLTGLVGTVFIETGGAEQSWVSVAGLMVAVPAALLGGYLQMSRSKRHAEYYEQ